MWIGWISVGVVACDFEYECKHSILGDGAVIDDLIGTRLPGLACFNSGRKACNQTSRTPLRLQIT